MTDVQCAGCTAGALLHDKATEDSAMDVQAIFGLQFLLSLVVIGLLAKWKLSP